MAKSLRVLIVEDSEDDEALVLRELRQAGYQLTHQRVDTAEAMSRELREKTWDIVLSDYSMPKFSAPMALSLLQQSKLDLPFIIVSGTIGEDTAVAAMKTGANDYILKQNLARLVPAIEREIRDAEVRLSRRKAEEALIESEERYRNLFENAPLGIYRTTPQGEILLVNPALVKMLKYPGATELISRNLESGESESSYNRKRFKELIERDGRVVGLESTWICYDGSAISIRENAIAIRGKDGKVLYYDGTVEDITERKQFDGKIRMMEKLASLGQFSANIAHEIRNPLAAISLNVESLHRQLKIPKAMKETFDDLKTGIQRIQGIITDILNFSRSQKLIMANEDIHELIDESIHSMEKELKAAGIQLIKEYGSVPFKISVDKNQLIQVFVNLLINARDAIQGGGTVTIRSLLTKDHVEVQVQDTGKGIPVENLDRIFEPFFTTKTRGTGLGLAIVYKIIEQHQAKISVESNPQTGTLFRIRFPL